MPRKSNISRTASHAEQVTAFTLKLESDGSISLILNMWFPHFGQEGVVIVSSRHNTICPVCLPENRRQQGTRSYQLFRFAESK